MKAFVVRCIRWYQRVSRSLPATPLLFGNFSGCRSWPTCSDYAIDAVQRQGVWRGMLTAIPRVLRCHPL